MDRAQIDKVICKIMVNDGPDRNVDGHEVITEFVVAAMSGLGERWAEAYEQRLAAREAQRKREDESWLSG